MSLTFTNGEPAEKPAPGKPQDKPIPPNPQLKNLQRQKEMLDKKIQRLQPKRPLADSLRDAASKLAQNPSDDPQDLFRQVRPLLDKMRLANSVMNNKTELLPNKTNAKGMHEYVVTMRRESTIDGDNIERMRREKDSIDYIQWTAQGICLYLWFPYTQPQAPAGPTAPGMTPAP